MDWIHAGLIGINFPFRMNIIRPMLFISLWNWKIYYRGFENGRNFSRSEKTIGKIDFESIWHGFHLYPFVLYTQDEAILDGCIIPTLIIFMQIRQFSTRIDGLRSGMRNTYKFTKLYSGKKQFIEGDIFKTIDLHVEIGTREYWPSQ